jgi:hypothetical protein
MSRISEIRVVNPGHFAAEFPRCAPSSSFFSGLWITDSLSH